MSRTRIQRPSEGPGWFRGVRWWLVFSVVGVAFVTSVLRAVTPGPETTTTSCSRRGPQRESLVLLVGEPHHHLMWPPAREAGAAAASEEPPRRRFRLGGVRGHRVGDSRVLTVGVVLRHGGPHPDDVVDLVNVDATATPHPAPLGRGVGARCFADRISHWAIAALRLPRPRAPTPRPSAVDVRFPGLPGDRGGCRVHLVVPPP